MKEELLEKMAEQLHIAWIEEKSKQGYHHPRECPTDRRGCFKCHEQMKPYDKLTEEFKELDRNIVRGVEKYLKKCGQIIIDKKFLESELKRFELLAKEAKKIISKKGGKKNVR